MIEKELYGEIYTYFPRKNIVLILWTAVRNGLRHYLQNNTSKSLIILLMILKGYRIFPNGIVMNIGCEVII